MKTSRVCAALFAIALPSLAAAAADAPSEPRTATVRSDAPRALPAPQVTRMLDFLASSIGTEQETLASPHVPPGPPAGRPPASPPGQNNPPNPPGKPADRPPQR